MEKRGNKISFNKYFIKKNILLFILLFVCILLVCGLGSISQPLSRHNYTAGFIICNFGSDLFTILGIFIIVKIRLKIKYSTNPINGNLMFYAYFISLALTGVIITAFFKILVTINPSTIFNVVGIISIGITLARLLILALVAFIPARKKSNIQSQK